MVKPLKIVIFGTNLRKNGVGHAQNEKQILFGRKTDNKVRRSLAFKNSNFYSRGHSYIESSHSLRHIDASRWVGLALSR